MNIVGQDKPSLDELAHYGIKGMKWGIRRGAEKSGIGRIRGAASQALMDEARRRNTASRLGFAGSHVYGAFKGNPLRGKRGQARVARKQMAAAERVRTGKTKTMDFLRAAKNIRMLDLVITTTPRKGATGYDGKIGSGTGK